jgi:hypothetical protein
MSNQRKISPLEVFFFVLALTVSGCSLMPGQSPNSSQSTSTNSQIINTGPATTVPTADAVVARIQTGLSPGGVSSLSGNFKTVLAQVSSNLPQDSDPTKASGFNQVPRLVYAACSDIGATKAKSVYGVDTTKAVSAQSANLVTAGVNIVNQYVGGMASSDPSMNQKVNQVFSTLIADDNAAGASTLMTFVSVCTAAGTFGVGMLGF